MEQKPVGGKTNAYDWLVKILIIGDSGVGKTNILLRICDDRFNATHLTTLGVDFKIKTIEIENRKIKMQIWDTAGQERFRTITQTYYKGAMGIIMTYAINDRNSFNNINNWMKQIKDHASDRVCLLLVGNKCDSKDRVVDESEGKKLADDYNIPFVETSAKENINIQECFQTIGRDVAEKILANSNVMETFKKAGNIKMQTPSSTEQPNQAESGGCKC